MLLALAVVTILERLSERFLLLIDCCNGICRLLGCNREGGGGGGGGGGERSMEMVLMGGYTGGDW